MLSGYHVLIKRLEKIKLTDQNIRLCPYEAYRLDNCPLNIRNALSSKNTCP